MLNDSMYRRPSLGGAAPSGRWWRSGRTIVIELSAPVVQFVGELEEEYNLTREQLATLRYLAHAKAERIAHGKRNGQSRKNIHEEGLARRARELYEAAVRKAKSQGFDTAVADLNREFEGEGEVFEGEVFEGEG